jgi:hypothetical protein
MIRGDAVREYIRGSLWVLPTASTFEITELPKALLRR